jgi:hypothetical protein
MDSERRSGSDRRKQTGINMRTFVGNGARMTIRRQEDKDHIFFVDQYSPILFVTIVAILFLCVIDAILTLYLLNHGAYETNRLMSHLLNFDHYTFFVFKYGLTIIATFCLLMFRCDVIACGAICTLVCNVDLPAAWLLCDEPSFAFHSYCQNAYGLDFATENRPIGHLANVYYKVYP